MSDFRMVSPLLDGYTLEKTVMTQRDRTWYSVRHIDSGENFVLKHISVPASDAQVRALILSGIYKSENDVLAYYTGIVSDIRKELDTGKKLAETGCFAGAVDYQIEQKTDGIGYDIYILQELQVPLNELINRNGMTHLRAINLGIDLCDAIIACREAGYLFANLKPDNIFLVPSGKFMLGDLGLIPLQDLEYAGIPESYIDAFSAPELFDITSSPNITVDLYSLGMVLYRIYNGNHGPFEDENTNVGMADKLRLSGKPLPTPIYADYELAAIITKACAYRIASRYSSPEKLKEALILYLQRNEIPDSLIVPPLVVDPEPVVPDEEELMEEAPLRMVDADELDAAFKASFAPSTENIGTDTPDPIVSKSPEKDLPQSTETPISPDKDESVSKIAVDLPLTEKENKSKTELTIVSTDDKVVIAVPAPTDNSKASETPAADIQVKVENASASEKASSVEEKKATSPAASEQKSGEQVAPTQDPLSANTVTGPKMPTGNLKMKKKGKHSKRRENLVVEIPFDQPEESQSEKEVAPPVVIPDSPGTDSAPAVGTDSPTPQPNEVTSSKEPTAVLASTANTPEKAADKEELASPSTDEVSRSMNIDELIASVNEVVGSPAPKEKHVSDDGDENTTLTMHVAPIEKGYVDPYEDTTPEATEGSHESKGKSKWLPLTIIAILTVALIGVIAFLLNNYYVNISALNLVGHSTEDITVELISPDVQDCFIVTCTDNYGNSYPRTIEGNHYTFSGLRENTAYTVTVIASEYHRLRSGKAYTMTVKTPGTTKITEFTARRGTQAGDVVLKLSSEGPSPEEWQYTYTDSNGIVSGPFPFSDQTALVSNLTEGATYTFEIQAPRDLYLSGETTIEYTLLPIVTVHTLHITDVSGKSVSVAWDYRDNAPQEWIVTCEAQDYSKSVTTSELKATFSDLPDFTRDYTFTVSAVGVEDPAVLTLPANPIILEDLKAEYTEDGTVSITWNTPAGSPEHGWHLTYNTVGSFHVPYFVRDITTNSVELENLIPNTEYEFSLFLTSEDSSLDLFGETTTTLTTAEAEAFTDYDINPTPVYGKETSNVTLWLCPEKEDWAYTDLENLRTNFTKDERIAICIQVESVSASEDTVDLLYILRDETGHVVVDERQEFSWDSLWFERRHANEIPLPREEGQTSSTPGTYTLEIYINGKLLVQKDVVIA